MENQVQQAPEYILEAYAETIRAPLAEEVERLRRLLRDASESAAVINEQNELLRSKNDLSFAADVLIAKLRDEWGKLNGDIEKQIDFFKRISLLFGISIYDGYCTRKINHFLASAFGRRITPILILLNEKNLAEYIDSVQYPDECTKGFLISVIKNPFYPTNGAYSNRDLYFQNGGKLTINEHFTYVPYSELAKSPYWNDADVFDVFISVLGTEEMGAKYRNYQYVIKMACDAYRKDVDKLNKIAGVLATNEICKKCAADGKWFNEMARLAFICINASPQAAKTLMGWANTATNSLVHISKFPAELRKPFFSKMSTVAISNVQIFE